MQFNAGFQTDVGRKRSQNQDSGATHPDLGLFLVSDGMGGHKGGETASTTAVEVISRFVQEAQKREDWNPREVIYDALVAANKVIFQLSSENPELQGMGTTTTALLFRENKLTIGHVGDSRCYFARPDGLWQLTRDHSLVQEKLRAGLITRAAMKTDQMRNVITRSVGFEKEVNVEIFEMTVQSGDCFMICTDGLTGLVEDTVILDLIQKFLFTQGDLHESTRQLVLAANNKGGDDNITSILVQVK